MSPDSEAQAVSVQTFSIALEHPPELGVDLSIDCQDYPSQRSDDQSPDYQLGILLSNFLQCGVLIATVTVLLGGILYLLQHAMEPVNYHIFHGEPAGFRSPAGVIESVFSGRRRGVVQLGLLFLIATPVLRVLISFLFFIKQRDIPYILITGLVISGLLYSLLAAYF